jgi:hypothetical protein
VSFLEHLITGEVGTCYLIHLATPLGNDGNGNRNSAEHYIGWTGGELAARIASHLRSEGSSLLAEANRRGIEWEVVRTWTNVDRHFERRLKRRGGARAICPTCSPAAAERRARLLVVA